MGQRSQKELSSYRMDLHHLDIRVSLDEYCYKSNLLHPRDNLTDYHGGFV